MTCSLGALAVATLAAAVAVLLAAVDPGAARAPASGRPPANGALGGHAFLWAVALNSLGTLSLVGGSLLSIVRRQRVRAEPLDRRWRSGRRGWRPGSRARATTPSSTSGELLGIALMFAGFTFVGRAPRPSVARRSEPRLEKTALAR